MGMFTAIAEISFDLPRKVAMTLQYQQQVAVVFKAAEKHLYIALGKGFLKKFKFFSNFSKTSGIYIALMQCRLSLMLSKVPSKKPTMCDKYMRWT